MDRKCVEAEPLFIKKEDYEKYMQLKSLDDYTDFHGFTHSQVAEKFINTGFNPDESILKIEQTSAVNQTIKDALDKKAQQQGNQSIDIFV